MIQSKSSVKKQLYLWFKVEEEVGLVNHKQLNSTPLEIVSTEMDFSKQRQRPLEIFSP